MPMTTSNSAPFLSPDQVGDILVNPVADQSVAAQACTVIMTSSHVYRVPVWTTDPSAAWVPEATEIPLSQGAGVELPITPQSVKGLTPFSVEFEEDATPEAIQQLQAGLVRDVVRTVDKAFFADSGQPDQPSGLADLQGINQIDAAGWVNADPFSLAVVNAEARFTEVSSWVCNPATLGKLMIIKEGSTSSRPLLDTVVVADAVQRQIAGAKLLVSPYVPDDTVYGLPQNRCIFVIRDQAEVTRHEDTLASSGQVLLRTVMRIGFGFSDPASVSKISTSPATPIKITDPTASSTGTTDPTTTAPADPTTSSTGTTTGSTTSGSGSTTSGDGNTTGTATAPT